MNLKMNIFLSLLDLHMGYFLEKTVHFSLKLNILELLAVFHENWLKQMDFNKCIFFKKRAICLTYNCLIIFFLWVWKFCWISMCIFSVVNKKQLAKISTSRRSQVTQVGFFFHYKKFRHVYPNLTVLNLRSIRPGMATKSWWNCTPILL